MEFKAWGFQCGFEFWDVGFWVKEERIGQNGVNLNWAPRKGGSGHFFPDYPTGSPPGWTSMWWFFDRDDQGFGSCEIWVLNEEELGVVGCIPLFVKG